VSGTEVTRHALPGGALLLLEPSRALPLVHFTLSLRSGAVHDPAGREGLTRVMARMLRRGAEGLPARVIEDTLDRLGGELSEGVAASRIQLHATVLRRNADAFVDLVSKVIGTPTFPEDELGMLLRETRGEILEARDNDGAVCRRFHDHAVYARHPYGRTVRGTTKSLERLDVEAVRASYATHFKRGNVVLGMSGDASVEDAIRWGTALVERLPDGGPVADPTQDPAPLEGRRLVFVDKPDRTQTQILVGAMGTHPRDPDHLPLVVANAVLGGTFTARMMREIRSKRGWSYGASSRLQVDRARRGFSMSAFPAATDCAKCVALELELLRTWVEGGITPRELGFMQKFLVRSWAFEIDTAQKRVDHALDVETLALPADYYAGYREHVRGVTLDAANAAVKNRIDPSRLVVTVLGTAKDLADEVAKAIPDLASVTVVPYDRELDDEA
jgi:zinc protease